MLGLTNYIIITVVNNIFPPHAKPTNYFDRYKTVRIAALRSINIDTIGNQHVRSDIFKQAFEHSNVSTIRKAYGLMGLDYVKYTAFKNGLQLKLDDDLSNKDELLLINNSLLSVSMQYITDAISRHILLPNKINK